MQGRTNCRPPQRASAWGRQVDHWGSIGGSEGPNPPLVQCEAPKIAKLVNITPITMVYGTQITIVTGANLNQLITGGPHIGIIKKQSPHIIMPL